MVPLLSLARASPKLRNWTLNGRYPLCSTARPRLKASPDRPFQMNAVFQVRESESSERKGLGAFLGAARIAPSASKLSKLSQAPLLLFLLGFFPNEHCTTATTIPAHYHGTSPSPSRRVGTSSCDKQQLPSGWRAPANLVRASNCVASSSGANVREPSALAALARLHSKCSLG